MRQVQGRKLVDALFKRIVFLYTLVALPVSALAAEPAPDVKGAINRGLSFLAKDHLVGSSPDLVTTLS